MTFKVDLDQLPLRAVTSDAAPIYGYPEPNFVISYDADGNPLSTYGEPSWNLTPFHPNKVPTTVYFTCSAPARKNALGEKIQDQIRRLLYLLVFRRTSGRLACTTAYQYWSVLRALGAFCLEWGITLDSALSSCKVLVDFVEASGSLKACKYFLALNDLLDVLPYEDTGFAAMTKHQTRPIRILWHRYIATLKQHAPLPSRLYTRLISCAVSEMEAYELVENELIDMACAVAIDPYLGRHPETQRSRRRRHEDINQVAPEPQVSLDALVSEQLKDYLITRGFEFSVYGLRAALTTMQHVCKLAMHVFSGARDAEITHLPFNCHITTKLDGEVFHLLTGDTSKLNNGIPKDTFWVTSAIGYRAVGIAQRICTGIQRVHKTLYPDAAVGKRGWPLFLSTGYLYPNTLRQVDRPFAASALDLGRLNSELFERWNLRIEQADIDELTLIDPSRGWLTEDEYAVGALWPLKSHQLRRSLALYATSSGYVQITSLKHQLKQMVVGMAAFYAKGSLYAINLLKMNKTHIAGVVQETEAEAQTLSLVSNVLLSDDPILGAFGIFAMNHFRTEHGVVTLEKRSTIEAEVRRGTLAYHDNALGGCGSVEPCKKRSMRSIAACIGCDKAAIKLSRLQRAIATQRILLANTPVDQIEHRYEQDTLECLVRQLKRFDKLLKQDLR